jgi:xylan 1,4-beta-xylosidase
VESWYWDVWNEPDSGYWKGNPQEYQKLYDYTADGLKRALPSARVGGPHSTRPANEIPAKFLRDFLDHVTAGRNYATGKTGSPIDYIGFHAKGLPVIKDNKVVMGSDVHLRNIAKGFEIVASYPTLKNLPIIIGESDPEGCAACSVRFNPQNAYRNGTLYAAYTAATFAREYELAKLNNVNFLGAVTWAFEFEGQPYFDGYRDLATNGIDKPVLNVFRMFGLMGGEQVESSSSGQLRLDQILKDGVKSQPDTGSLASRGDRAVNVLVWNYHDNESPGPPADVALDIKGLPEGKVLLQHYRVDGQHGNSFEVWKSMGSPQNPSAEQYSQLERAGQLQTLGSPYWQSTVSGRLALRFPLPRHAVSLVRVTW